MRIQKKIVAAFSFVEFALFFKRVLTDVNKITSLFLFYSKTNIESGLKNVQYRSVVRSFVCGCSHVAGMTWYARNKQRCDMYDEAVSREYCHATGRILSNYIRVLLQTLIASTGTLYGYNDRKMYRAICLGIQFNT